MAWHQTHCIQVIVPRNAEMPLDKKKQISAEFESKYKQCLSKICAGKYSLCITVTWKLSDKLLSDEFYKMSLMISQHWFS